MKLNKTAIVIIILTAPPGADPPEVEADTTTVVCRWMRLGTPALAVAAVVAVDANEVTSLGYTVSM